MARTTVTAPKFSSVVF